MSALYMVFDARHYSFSRLPLRGTDELQRAVAKLVAVGERAGISIDQMIGLLNSGLTVNELVEYVLIQTADAA